MTVSGVIFVIEFKKRLNMSNLISAMQCVKCGSNALTFGDGFRILEDNQHLWFHWCKCRTCTHTVSLPFTQAEYTKIKAQPGLVTKGWYLRFVEAYKRHKQAEAQHAQQ